MHFIVDHQNVDIKNLDCVDFDGLNIDGQPFWAVKIQIINNYFMFDKKVGCYEKKKAKLTSKYVYLMAHFIVDYQNQHSKNLDCSDYDGLNTDGQSVLGC